MADQSASKKSKIPRDSGEDSEDESEILEESPGGRWVKRREEVKQRDVPGIDVAYLAMDTEEGVEVVWNEVQFSERKNFKAEEEKVRQTFDNLTQLEHPNIVKFHKYWTDTVDDKPRVVFITEYMSSGSLKQFLKKTKFNAKRLPLQAWKRWCTQILSALSYLHSCSPPIIHGNLTCDTIFIQHNGLIKIGSVAPDAIHHHVKTCRERMKNMHYVAPEYGNGQATTAVDIYSFGICALEMAALEIHGNGEGSVLLTEEIIKRTINSLDDDLQRDFIRNCLSVNPQQRPHARQLLFHAVLFEVHSLKLLAAHNLLSEAANLSETITDDLFQQHYGPDIIVAETVFRGQSKGFRMCDVPHMEKLEKFMEDVKFGIYPLTTFAMAQPTLSRPRPVSPEVPEAVKQDTPEPYDKETRKVIEMMCSIKQDSATNYMMTVFLRLDDKMNRQLSCSLAGNESADVLAEELVTYGFINEGDKMRILELIDNAMKNTLGATASPNPVTVALQ